MGRKAAGSKTKSGASVSRRGKSLLVRQVRRGRTVYVKDERGKRIGVAIPLRKYETMLEDLHDLAVVAERRGEDSRPLEEVLEELKSEGLLAS